MVSVFGGSLGVVVVANASCCIISIAPTTGRRGAGRVGTGPGTIPGTTCAGGWTVLGNAFGYPITRVLTI
jgi:hypothetical protein